MKKEILKTMKDMDFKPKPEDIWELNIVDNYVIFKQHKKTKFAIKKGSGKIKFSGKSFGFKLKLRK